MHIGDNVDVIIRIVGGKRSNPRLISSTSTESSMNGINIRFPLPITKVITKRAGSITAGVILKIKSRNSLHTKLVNAGCGKSEIAVTVS